jgi:hypothetical protein
MVDLENKSSEVTQQPAGKKETFRGMKNSKTGCEVRTEVGGEGHPWDNSSRPCTRAHFFRVALFARFALAAASDAFLARAERSSAVIFRAAVLPPWLPYRLPIARRYSRTSAGIRFAMPPSYT